MYLLRICLTGCRRFQLLASDSAAQVLAPPQSAEPAGPRSLLARPMQTAVPLRLPELELNAAIAP